MLALGVHSLWNRLRTFGTLKRPWYLPQSWLFHILLSHSTLYMDEARGIAKEVLMQALGPWKGPMAYLSKSLYPVIARWLECIRAIANCHFPSGKRQLTHFRIRTVSDNPTFC